MAWSCEGVHLSDYFLCLTSDMLQQRQLTERIVPNQRATSLKAQLLHGKFDFPRRSLWSKKKLLSKAATVLLFFFAFWRMMHSDPLSPSFKKYMTVTTNVWIIMIQERSCASTCVNHMASNSFAQALAHAVAPHHGFNRRGLRPLDVFAQAPAKWTCFIAWAFVLYGLPRSWGDLQLTTA